MAYYPFATELGARYALVGPDGTTAVFNDPADPNYVGMISELAGLDSADVRESATELVEADGGTHGNFYAGRRPISMTAKVFGHATVLQRNAKMDLARRASNALRSDATLSWKPSTRRENFVVNPRGQFDTSGWGTLIVPGSTLSRVATATPPVGTTALQLTTTGSGASGQGFATTPFNLVAGRTYYVSIALQRTAGTGGVSADVYTPGGAVHATVASLITSGSWGVYTAAFVATASVAATLHVFSPNSNTNAGTFQFSDAMVTNNSVAYFDGDTAGYYWQGDQGNSASGDFVEMFANVRRQQPFRESGAWNKDVQIALVSANAFLYSTGLKTVVNGVAAENRGSAPAYPIINVTGASSNPTVSDGTRTLVTTGLTGGTALAAGETIQFDTLNHTAKFTAGARNGQSANRFVDYSATRWPYLTQAASTTFTVGGGGTATIQYRDTWA